VAPRRVVASSADGAHDILEPSYESGHCSAFIRLLSGNAELYASQVTWSSFENMLRVYKRYELPFSLTGSRYGAAYPSVPATAMEFSGYFGQLSSGDDWYTTNAGANGLAVFETTIGNNNASLWKFVQPTTVMEWARSLLAHRLAANGSAWADIFSAYNSGTYSNAWMAVDYNKFTPGAPPAPGALWLVEQLPGFMNASDVTPVLVQQGYFASYNVCVHQPRCGLWAVCSRSLRVSAYTMRTIWPVLTPPPFPHPHPTDPQALLPLHLRDGRPGGAGGAVRAVVLLQRHRARQHLPPQQQRGGG
jgi:hypothetical protein